MCTDSRSEHDNSYPLKMLRTLGSYHWIYKVIHRNLGMFFLDKSHTNRHTTMDAFFLTNLNTVMGYIILSSYGLIHLNYFFSFVDEMPFYLQRPSTPHMPQPPCKKNKNSHFQRQNRTLTVGVSK